MNLKITLSAVALCMGMQNAVADPITRSQAREVAQAFIGIDDTTPDNTDIQPYYVFSRGLGRGYVIVSGDDSTAPIFGYTERGDFDDATLPVQLKGMLKTFADKVTKIQQQPQSGRRPTVAQRLRAARAGASDFKKDWESVPVLLTTNWSQGYPYNILCPYQANGTARCATGCEATAAAQIAFYFRKDNPESVLYDTKTGQYASGQPIKDIIKAGTPYDWAYMKSSGGGNTRQNNAVATLMYVLGTEAKMQYGPASGAFTRDMSQAMSRQLRLDNTYRQKSNYSQTGWEQLIYGNLKSQRPLLYAGSNDEGGHAVVLDGYQASTGLYHFNFGWGGPGNGYFTVDDSTGMNGFRQWQECIADVTPKMQNLQANITTDRLYSRAQSDISVTVTNEGTLPYAGIMVYASYNKRITNRANYTNDEVEIAPRDSATFSFSFRPTREAPVTIFVTDKNRNIIDSVTVPITPTMAQLQQNSISVAAGSATTTVEGITFAKVNNSRAYVTATLTNSGTYSQPAVRCLVDSFNTADKSWTRITTRANNDTVFAEGETKAVTFDINLESGRYYRAYMAHDVTSGEKSELTFANNDTVVYFSMAQPDLKITADGRQATITGNWDEALFAEMATDSTVTSYDFTGVKELSVQPQAANKNALFTINETAPEGTGTKVSARRAAISAAGLKNFVVNGVCDSLVISKNYEFKPAAAFKATHARFYLGDVKAGQWQDIIVPFEAVVPQGMVARAVDSMSTNRIHMSNLKTVKAMQPIVFVTDRNTLDYLEGSNVSVSTDTVGVAAFENGTFSAATVNSTAGSIAHVFTAEPNQFFFSAVEDSVMAPFQTVIVSSYKRNYSVLGQVPGLTFVADRSYRYLADTLNVAYEALAAHEHEATPEAVATFRQAITTAEQLFTAQAETNSNNIDAQAKVLSDAIQAFLANAEATGISPVVSSRAIDMSAPAEYYNLSGQRIDKPTRGIVIVKQGNKSRKMVVK